MIAALLAIALTARDPLPIVDVCEINTTGHLRQVVLYRWHWSPQGKSHRVSQWWEIVTEPIVSRRGGVWHVQSCGREFLARTLRRTTTAVDPEVADRSAVGVDDRMPYDLGCGK